MKAICIVTTTIRAVNKIPPMDSTVKHPTSCQLHLGLGKKECGGVIRLLLLDYRYYSNVGYVKRLCSMMTFFNIAVINSPTVRIAMAVMVTVLWRRSNAGS